MTEQDWFKLENTSSLSQDFICVCHSLNGLDTGWLLCVCFPSDLPRCLYHFISGGEPATVISVNFSLSFHKSARRHSQQRTIFHCLHQALHQLHNPHLWGIQDPPRRVYVQKLGLNATCPALCQSTQIPREAQTKNTDISNDFNIVPRPGNPMKALVASQKDVHVSKCGTQW